MKRLVANLARNVPRASFRLMLNTRADRGAAIPCIVNRDIRADPEVLGAYCFRPLTPVIQDLVLIASAIAFADRVVPRRLSVAWRRELELKIPVHDPEFWRQRHLMNTLVDFLTLLTGDTWCIVFEPGGSLEPFERQPTLPLGDGARVAVIPYSDGLDFFCCGKAACRR